MSDYYSDLRVVTLPKGRPNANSLAGYSKPVERFWLREGERIVGVHANNSLTWVYIATEPKSTS